MQKQWNKKLLQESLFSFENTLNFYNYYLHTNSWNMFFFISIVLNMNLDFLKICIWEFKILI